MFTFNLLPRQSIERVDDPILGRVYNTPIGPLKSVTTILSENIPAPQLEAWRQRVGVEEANRISNQATRRGTAIHKALEKYLLNEDWKTGLMPTNTQTMLSLLPILDNRVRIVRGLEFPLWSRHLKAAGTTDLIAEFDGRLSIVDFKTSKRLKTEDYIQSYFYQTTAYSIMVQELYELVADQLVIIIAVDQEYPQVFIRERNKYLDQTIKLFTGR